MKYHPAHLGMYPYLIQSVTTIITDYDILTIIVIAYNNNYNYYYYMVWYPIIKVYYIHNSQNSTSPY